MTDVLRVVLVVIGVVLALLAAWVVAPDGPIREARLARGAVSRILRRSRPVNITRTASGTGEGTLRVTGSVQMPWWSLQDSVEGRLQVLHDQVVDLRRVVSGTDEKIREELGGRIDAVATDVAAQTSRVMDHWAKYQENEERSSKLDATGVLPAVFGVVLGAMSDALAAVAWIGVPLAFVGIGLVVRCVVVLRIHLRQRPAPATAAGTTATS